MIGVAIHAKSTSTVFLLVMPQIGSRIQNSRRLSRTFCGWWLDVASLEPWAHTIIVSIHVFQPPQSYATEEYTFGLVQRYRGFPRPKQGPSDWFR